MNFVRLHYSPFSIIISLHSHFRGQPLNSADQRTSWLLQSCVTPAAAAVARTTMTTDRLRGEEIVKAAHTSRRTKRLAGIRRPLPYINYSSGNMAKYGLSWVRLCFWQQPRRKKRIFTTDIDTTVRRREGGCTGRVTSSLGERKDS